MEQHKVFWVVEVKQPCSQCGRRYAITDRRPGKHLRVKAYCTKCHNLFWLVGQD